MAREMNRYKSPMLQAEVQTLKAKKFTIDEIMKATGETKYTVRAALDDMGLTVRNEGRRCLGRCGPAYEAEFQEKVLALRAKNDMSVINIVKELNSSVWTVTKVLTAAGILQDARVSKKPREWKQCDTCSGMFEPYGAGIDCQKCRKYHQKMEAEDEARLIESEKKQYQCKCGKLYASPKDAHGKKIHHNCYECRIEVNKRSGGLG